MNRPAPIAAFGPFFVAGALLAAMFVPIWALTYTGLINWAPTDAARWHGHEMIFGYALAVVGGFLFTRLSRPALALTFAAWLAARAAFLIDGTPHWIGAAVVLAYPACLVAFGAAPFLRAAKSGRNLVFAPILAGFFVAELLYQLGALGLLANGTARGLAVGIDLLALLLFTMGGRIIAAATSGARQDKGTHPANVAQPRLQAIGVGALALLAALEAVRADPVLVALPSGLGAMVILARLAGWRAWTVIDAAPVAVLHLGYLWLALGLAWKAAAPFIGLPSVFDADHAITVGSVGTLTLAMMVRVAQQRTGRPIQVPARIGIAVLLLSAAAAARAFLAGADLRSTAILIAAAGWTAAFLLLLNVLVPMLIGPARGRRLFP